MRILKLLILLLTFPLLSLAQTFHVTQGNVEADFPLAWRPLPLDGKIEDLLLDSELIEPLSGSNDVGVTAMLTYMNDPDNNLKDLVAFSKANDKRKIFEEGYCTLLGKEAHYKIAQADPNGPLVKTVVCFRDGKRYVLYYLALKEKFYKHLNDFDVIVKSLIVK